MLKGNLRLVGLHRTNFFLKTQGKSRGYSERSEFGRASDGEPIKVTFKINGEPRDKL